MVNILVNGFKAKAGGGKSILRTYLSCLRDSPHGNTYFVLTPDEREYESFSSPHIKVIGLPRILDSNILGIFLYLFVLPRLVRRNRIDVILNFGDIVIPTRTPQLYYFDWAFATYPESVCWKLLGLRDRVVYAVKLISFKAFIRHASMVVAQTHVMARRLNKIYGLQNVVVVPNAVSLDNFQGANSRFFDLPRDKIKLLYLANYYPHKNIEIFLPLAKLIRKMSLPYVLLVTLSPSEHNGARKFLDAVSHEGLGDVIINVGPVGMREVASLFQQSDALLMPTLLETFGAPYVEAMFHRRIVLTSDLDFAHAVCEDAACYFDPLDPGSILRAIHRAFANDASRQQLIDAGARRLGEMWSWDSVFSELQSLLGRLSLGSSGAGGEDFH